jgi:molybdenum cofactor biosynthesis enzyme MoaA
VHQSLGLVGAVVSEPVTVNAIIIYGFEMKTLPEMVSAFHGYNRQCRMTTMLPVGQVHSLVLHERMN